MRYSNRRETSFYSSGSGPLVTVYAGSPSNDRSPIAGYFDSSGTVYRGSPAGDRSSRLGYVGSSGMIYRGSPGSDHSSLIGYVVRGPSTFRVFEGHPGSDHASHVADVGSGSASESDRDVMNFCGACLLFSIADTMVREMAICPRCGRLRHPNDPVDIRFCSYCGYLCPPA